MEVYAYLFVDIEKEFRVPLEEQQFAVERYIVSLGLQLGQIFVEQHVSARRPFSEREQGKALLQNCSAGDMIVAARVAALFCRAGEGMRLVHSLSKRSIALHVVELGGDIVLPGERKLMVSEGIHGMVQALLTSLAERERPGNSTAIRYAKKQRKKEGRYLGGPIPFGWKVSSTGLLEENSEQQQLLRQMELLREERWSYRDIARIIKEKHQLQMSHEGVRKALVGNAQRRQQSGHSEIPEDPASEQK